MSVTVKLTSGLGNQLFQYAAGYALARRLDSNLKVDLSWYKNIPNGEVVRSLGISNFDVRINESDAAENMKVKLSKLSKQYLGAFGVSFYNILENKSYKFDKHFQKLRGNVFLDGYWQNEKYFLDVKDEIRDLYKPKKLSKKVFELQKVINSTKSCAIHIRRGDYTFHASASKFRVLDEKYYTHALRIFNAKNNKYFVFSDDSKWVREQKFIPKNSKLVSDEKLKDWEELWLMSNCKNIITANSTFSWWGAWLGGSENKVVITPKQWHVNPKESTNGLLPSKWIQI